MKFITFHQMTGGTDAIKDINIIKGGMPAEYGGRLSSVLDITMKDRNNKKYQADGGIGLLSSRLTLQGPIQKEKSSFILSGRRTYIDVLSQPFLDRAGVTCFVAVYHIFSGFPTPPHPWRPLGGPSPRRPPLGAR